MADDMPNEAEVEAMIRRAGDDGALQLMGTPDLADEVDSAVAQLQTLDLEPVTGDGAVRRAPLCGYATGIFCHHFLLRIILHRDVDIHAGHVDEKNPALSRCEELGMMTRVPLGMARHCLRADRLDSVRCSTGTPRRAPRRGAGCGHQRATTASQRERSAELTLCRPSGGL